MNKGEGRRQDAEVGQKYRKKHSKKPDTEDIWVLV